MVAQVLDDRGRVLASSDPRMRAPLLPTLLEPAPESGDQLADVSVPDSGTWRALVHPVVRDYPLETMRPGDVFFHNDVYLSEGGIGHLPDLCVTVPVFHEGEVVAFVQAFGHHDDIGGAVPGSMPSHATSVFEEGLMVPPIRLWDAGVPTRPR